MEKKQKADLLEKAEKRVKKDKRKMKKNKDKEKKKDKKDERKKKKNQGKEKRKDKKDEKNKNNESNCKSKYLKLATKKESIRHKKPHKGDKKISKVKTELP